MSILKLRKVTKLSYSKKMSVSEVKINDGFWTPYIKNIREITRNHTKVSVD